MIDQVFKRTVERSSFSSAVLEDEPSPEVTSVAPPPSTLETFDCEKRTDKPTMKGSSVSTDATTASNRTL